MNGEKTPVCHVDELNILGTHNHENAMAAAGMAAAYGVPVDVIPMQDYGMCNGMNVLKFAYKLAKNK